MTDGMKSTEKPSPKQTPTNAIFIILSLLCLVTSVDRSIVGGAFSGISSFVSNAPDTPEVFKKNPSAGVGLISSVFIVGYSFSMVLTGHLAHKIKWKNLAFGGMVIWTITVWLSGLSYDVNSFYLLIFSRLTSGVAEASFYVIAPPIIEERGGAHAGLWMSIFVGAFPLGVAIGIFFGAIISNTYNWSYCFYTMAYATLPLVISVFFIQDNVNGGVLAPDRTVNSCDGIEEDHKVHFTFTEEIIYCLTSKKLVAVILADAVQVAATTTLGTFGAALIFSLDLFDSEESSALAFGLVIALAAVTGTPFGGMITDVILEQLGANPSSDKILSALLPTISIGVGISCCFFLSTYILTFSTTAYMTAIFLGGFFSFSVTSAILRCILNSVDKDHRPNAVGMNAVLKHVLGDIPATIIFGLVKDSLTPGCIISLEGEYTDPEACKDQKNGSLITVMCIFVYYGFSIVFFELAHCLTLRDLVSNKSISDSSEKTVASLEEAVHDSYRITTNRKEN